MKRQDRSSLDQVTRLPLYYFDHANLEALGNNFGNYVAMDNNTFYLEVTSDTKIYIEINVTTLPKRIHLDNP